MQTIDIVCKEDITPRIELLVEYLSGLGVPVKLRRTLPQTPSRPVVLLAGQSSSTDQIFRENDLWSVAVYLDAKTQPIPATHQFSIPNWPARSCDPLLAKLAAYLKRPDDTPFPTQLQSASSTAAIQPTSRDARFQERVTLGAFAIAALAFLSWMVSSGTQEQTEREQPKVADVLNQDVPATTTQSVYSVDAEKGDSRDTSAPGDLPPSSYSADHEHPVDPIATLSNHPELASEFDRQLLAHPDQCLQDPPQVAGHQTAPR